MREARELTRDEMTGRLDWYCGGSVLAANYANAVLARGGGIAVYEDETGGWQVLTFGIPGAHSDAHALPAQVQDVDDDAVLLPLAGTYSGEPLPLRDAARG